MFIHRTPPSVAAISNSLICVAFDGARRAVAGGGDGSSSSTVDVLERATKAKLDKAAFEKLQAQRRAELHRRPDARAGAAGGGLDQQPMATAKPVAGSAPPHASNTTAFAKALHQLHVKTYEARKDSNITMKIAAAKEKSLAERRRILKFREIGTELDRVSLWRDFVGWIIALKRDGVDTLIDQALERELRFYTEESNRELKYNPKLFQGLPFLNKGHPFPSLHKLTRLSSTAAQKAKLAALLSADSNDSTTSGGEGSAGGDALIGAPRWARALGQDDGKQGTVSISRVTFVRPTLVTMSQLTYSASVQQLDGEWIRMLRENDDGADHVNARPSETELGLRRPPSARRSMFNPDNFDVMRLRSIDTHSVRLMRRPVLDLWAKTASVLEARETLLGDHLVRQFMPHFGLRNFSTTYCFLVDAQGKVRWMSAGAPSAAERDAFPTLLRDLEAAYHKTQASRN